MYNLSHHLALLSQWERMNIWFVSFLTTLTLTSDVYTLFSCGNAYVLKILKFWLLWNLNALFASSLYNMSYSIHVHVHCDSITLMLLLLLQSLLLPPMWKICVYLDVNNKTSGISLGKQKFNGIFEGGTEWTQVKKIHSINVRCDIDTFTWCKQAGAYNADGFPPK